MTRSASASYPLAVLPLIPFGNVTRRTAWLRATLLLATFFGLLASTPVWLNSHAFPPLPITGNFPVLAPPWDKFLFASMLVSLFTALWLYQPSIIYFLAASFFSFCEDQNRGQPWLYMYWVMLLLTLLPSPTNLAACRLALTAVYFWGGIQKLNPHFFEKTPAWFVQPAADWHLPSFAVDLLRWSAASAPFLEIAIAVGLWFSKSRLPALVAIIAMHLFAVLFLGPLGHKYNWVVWPWNLAMIALAIALFPTATRPRHAASLRKETWLALRPSKFALCVLVPFTLLPILSYGGMWDSYFSFSLYAENSATANIFVTERFRDALPSELRAYTISYPQYDPVRQGPFIFNFAPWGYEEMHVPPIAEPRNFRSVFNALRPYAQEPEDLRMIVRSRDDRVTFYQGDTSWQLPSR